MLNIDQVNYEAELKYRHQSIRRGAAADRLARQIRRRRPRRMDSVNG